MFRTLAGLVAVLAFTSLAYAQAPSGVATGVFTSGRITLELEDHAPRFLAWYDKAKGALDADARWQLWEEMYAEAAVPPTPQGKLLARRLLDAAWPRYDAALPFAVAGGARIAPAAAATLERVATLLELEQPGRLRLKTIIGGFERNAFAFRGQYPTIVIPLETIDASPLAIAHEGTHAVHMLIASLGGEWERSIAATALQEGLAMHVACEIVPRESEADCVGGAPEFWPQASAKRAEILQGARADLGKQDGQTVYKYTLGQGNAGLRREAYAIGWWVVGQLRREGMTLAMIARIPEARMPAVVDAAMARMQ